MHGAGNDFVMIDATAGAWSADPAWIRRLGDRHRGVGFDQLIVLVPPRLGGDVGVLIYNSDGSAARQCGNGMRCVAEMALRRGLVAGPGVAIETPGGIVRAEIESAGMVRVDMGPPRLEPAEVPFVADARASRYSLDVAGRTLDVGVASMGNPHAVTVVADVATTPVAELGPAVQGLAAFPEGVNVGFLEIRDRGHVRLRVYERGAGETLACGSGACAAVVVGRDQGLLDSEVAVDLPGGRLRVRWDGDAAPVWLAGPTARVFEGETLI
ncbi:MAG: diaminopimelate epimerase [Ectothiorhodospiraceae bacterium]|nr:diaminopimelate epimerase [Chromatiales bacterium]MCP5155013.1 diaminopimelate epimerase [Ectothiorhodospiraceae bacterium]